MLNLETLEADAMVVVVTQHAVTGAVLMVAFADREALERTLATGEMHYRSRRRGLWHKGATSGDTLDLVDVRVNCEQNSLLYRVRPRTGGVCHTKDGEGAARTTCYYRVADEAGALRFP